MKPELIEEVLADMLVDKTKKEEIMNIVPFIGNMTIDILISVINEVNMYPYYSVSDLLEDMNIEGNSVSYEMTVYDMTTGKKVDSEYDVDKPKPDCIICIDLPIFDEEHEVDRYETIKYEPGEYKLLIKGTSFIYNTLDRKYQVVYTVRPRYTKHSYSAFTNAYM